MVKVADRDLLVLSKNALESESAFQQEVKLLAVLLPRVEDLKQIARTSEVFDLNKCRTVKNSELVFKRLADSNLRPFEFVCNKN